MLIFLQNFEHIELFRFTHADNADIMKLRILVYQGNENALGKRLKEGKKD